MNVSTDESFLKLNLAKKLLIMVKMQVAKTNVGGWSVKTWFQQMVALIVQYVLELILCLLYIANTTVYILIWFD